MRCQSESGCTSGAGAVVGLASPGSPSRIRRARHTEAPILLLSDARHSASVSASVRVRRIRFHLPVPRIPLVLYLAIPAHNEVATIGVLLWRLRTVLAEFPREYEVVVYDDASTDETAEVAAQYERAMPVTVLRGKSRLGYAGAVDALLRHVATRTRYPRRDALLLMQGDFTDPPGIVPEFARRFEGGADLVVGERLTVADAPTAVKRLFKYGHWAMRPFVKVEGVADLTASMRLVRISALREAIRVAGTAPLVGGNSWTANADLLLRLAPHARRVESVPMEPTFGVRMRDTRRVAMADTISTLKWAWAARGRRAVVGSSPAESGPDDRRSARQQGRRREEPELSVERLREKVRERDGSTGIDGEQQDPRRRRRKERPEGERSERPARPERQERAERAERPARADRQDRADRPDRADRQDRAERTERTERPPRDKVRAPRPEREARPDGAAAARPPRRREDVRSPFNDPTLELDDPFAAPSARREAPRSDDNASVSDAAATASEFRDPEQVEVPTPRAPFPPMDQDDDDLPPRPIKAIKGSESLIAPGDAESLSGDEAIIDDDPANGEEESEDGEPRRKRRRNRRSRRGRRKKAQTGTEGAETGVDDEAGDDDGDQDASPEADPSAPSRGRVRFTPADHIDGEPVTATGSDTGDDGDEDGDDDLAGGVESMSEGAPRPRRRGRRGRRGGARRSRGRRETGGEEGGDSPPAEPAGEE